MSRLLIRGARLLGAEAADLLVDDGVIREIGSLRVGSDVEVLDADGLVALPGLVDLHVHLRVQTPTKLDPQQEELLRQLAPLLAAARAPATLREPGPRFLLPSLRLKPLLRPRVRSLTCCRPKSARLANAKHAVRRSLPAFRLKSCA